MERLKLAISKARESSTQLRHEQHLGAMGGPSPRSVAAAAALHAEPKRRSWALAAVPLMLGLAGLAAYWAVGSETGAEPMSASARTNATPSPQATMATPDQSAEPARPAGVDHATPASAQAPAVADGEGRETDKISVALNDQVAAAVDSWRKAWSARDMKAYLGAYSDDFIPRAGMSHREWVASRYRNVGGRKSIDVQIQNLEVQALEGDRARVSFLQDYTSGSTRERGQPKTLDLVRDTDDRWRIVGEWQDNPPPFAEAGKS